MKRHGSRHLCARQKRRLIAAEVIKIQDLGSDLLNTSDSDSTTSARSALPTVTADEEGTFNQYEEIENYSEPGEDSSEDEGTVSDTLNTLNTDNEQSIEASAVLSLIHI